METYTPSQFLQHTHEDGPSMVDPLASLIGVLRGPEGCPWDQKQTALSMIDYLIDEAHELKEALLSGNDEQIADEYGDLLFTTTFFQHLLEKQTSREDSVKKVVAKMISRHPHVFDSSGPIDEAEIRKNWESLKAQKHGDNHRIDRELPSSLSPLKRAEKILSRARNAGFRYPTAQQAWDKVDEEFFELKDALRRDDKTAMSEELGDLLLALLTASKESELDAGRSLTLAGRKFSDRIEALERLAGSPLSDIPSEQLKSLYLRSRGESDIDSAYFNYCGVSRWPTKVMSAVTHAIHRIGRSGLTAVLEFREEREQLRTQIGRLVGADEDQVAFIPNISAAAVGVAYSLDWKKGDSILLGRHEFPANSVPWKMAAKVFGVEVLEFDDDLLRESPTVGWSLLEEILTKHRPKLLALSSVSYWSGYRLPIPRVSALCRNSNTLLFIDAIQALGTVPVNAGDGIDILAAGSHKGLLSPEGSGFLVVNPRVQDMWVPRIGSWLSLPDPVDFLQSGRPDCAPNEKTPREKDPGVLEGSSLNTMGYVALSAALKVLDDYGVSNIQAHIQSLHDRLEEGMVELGWSSLRSPYACERSAILSFRPPSGLDLQQFHSHLPGRGLQLGTPNGVLRFGCHIFNTPAEIEYALQIIQEVTSDQTYFDPKH